jgi:hypothetical protein
MAALVPDALEDNRAGRLTATQRSNLRAMSRGWRKSELQFAAVFTVIGLLVWFADGPARYAALKPLVGIAFLLIAAALVMASFLGVDTLTRDLRAGRVAAADGAIKKWTETSHSRSSSLTSYYAEVGNVTVELGSQSYQALPDAGIMRLFYLPSSHRLVNFEQLGDRPLPDRALTDPHVLLGDAVAGIFGSADARAEIAAMGHAMQAQVQSTLTPPAAGETKPLQDSLPGTWSNVMMSVTFGADGSVTATLPGGLKRAGHWSIDQSGHLVSDVTGTPGAIEAWISGDVLTISIGGQGVTLRRS